MAEVRMRVSISGTRNGQRWPGIGGTVEVPQAEADTLVLAGLAEIVETAAVAVEAETAAVKAKPVKRARKTTARKATATKQ